MKLEKQFFTQDVLKVAPGLVGKLICRQFEDGSILRLRITETEAYKGEEDKACHASKGRTLRTEIMYNEGGRVYVYLIYGLHILLNIVTGKENTPQAVLVRCCEGYNGPAKVSRALCIDKSFYGEDLTLSNRIWLEDDNFRPKIKKETRVGIDYAPSLWKNKKWRFILDV